MIAETSPIAMVEDLAQGLMADFADTDHPSTVYGHTKASQLIHARTEGEADTAYVVGYEGLTKVDSGERAFTVAPGEYCAIPFTRYLLLTSLHENGKEGTSKPRSKAIIAVRLGYKGLATFGGPIEHSGRLKYIDGCSDTLLIGPPLKGDPCLNFLRFPPGIDQTSHTHPSIRAGVILSGRGICRTAHGDKDLVPGKVFILYPDAIHAFATTPEDGMRLSVFHPDTDTGPSHEDHPMLNRTIVDGVSARDLDEIRTQSLEE